MSNDLKKIKERIEKLKKEINYHRHLYHVLDRQKISDAALDSLKKELFDLEQKYPQFITPDSPTQRVGGEVLDKFQKVRHPLPMISFNDAFSEDDMRNWEKRFEKVIPAAKKEKSAKYYCELKIDGLAIELIYKNGVLTVGSTRGNGEIGENVTNNLKTVEAIPLRLLDEELIIKNLVKSGLKNIALNLKKNFPKEIVARGEVFLTKKEFERINKEQEQKGLKLYANPRNIAAGSVRQLNPKITALRKLDSYIYELITDLGQTTHEEKHLILKAFGFKTNPHNKPVADMKEIFQFRNYWASHREKLPYEIDGIVVILNNNKLFNEAGVVGKTPRAAIAYKFALKEAATIIEDIKIQVGRTGALTPVARLKPVQVGGITITHSTLHNFDEIKRLGLKIGDNVVVGRAGDVIPQITKVLANMRTGREKELKIPDKCPICGLVVVKDPEGIIYRCSNKKCFAQNREKIRHLVSRQAFDIIGLGPKIIDRFIAERLISDAADIFELKKEDISQMERFGDKSAENIIREINEKKEISLPRFIYGLGILHIGEKTAYLLTNYIISKKKNILKPTDLADFFQKVSREELQTVPDIGPKVALSIYEWFRNKSNIKYLEKFEKNGINIKSQREVGLPAKSQKLAGKIFVFTGELFSMSRDEAKEKVRMLGGEISESVGNKVNYVVAGENPGSKYERAKQLNVKIIDEKQFLEMIKYR